MTRHDWLEKRKTLITASDVAAILGEHPHKTALDVYAEKTSDGISDRDAIWLAYGRDVEEAVGRAYAHKTGREVVDLGATEITVHDDYPWLGATLDRVTIIDGIECPVECKSIDPLTSKIGPDAFAEDPPVHMQVQLQIQMACMGAPRGSLVAMFPGYQVRWVDIDFRPTLIDAVIPILKDFLRRVEEKDPPAPSTPKDLASVKVIYSTAEEGKTVELDDAAREIADAIDLHKAAIKEHDTALKLAESKMRALIGDAEIATLPDGTELTLKVTHRKAYTQEVKESTYRTLRRRKTK